MIRDMIKYANARIRRCRCRSITTKDRVVLRGLTGGAGRVAAGFRARRGVFGAECRHDPARNAITVVYGFVTVIHPGIARSTVTG